VFEVKEIVSKGDKKGKEIVLMRDVCEDVFFRLLRLLMSIT
jgi:hypothetical protein